jgi:thiol-disulfide isomerase/thioredoxin
MSILTKIMSMITGRRLMQLGGAVGGAVGSGESESFLSSYGMLIGAVLVVAVLSWAGYTYYNYLKSVSKEVYESVNDDLQTADRQAEILFFHTTWCPHCKSAKPEWDELRSAHDHSTINGYKVTFTEIDCTEETPEVEEMIQKYKVEGYPTIKLIKDGQVIEYDAKPTKETMLEFLNTVL